MKIQYCSDLHLEFPENKEFLKLNPLQPKADILLLGGDILPFYRMNKHNDFFDYVSDNFEFTYWIPGNHEYYHFDLAKKTGTLNEKIRSNVFLVNNISVEHDDINLIFSTLWTNIRPAYELQIERRLNDFHYIKYNNNRFSTIQYNHLYQESFDFLQHAQHRYNKPKTIVLTHHVPTFLNYPEKYKGDALNDAFAVELFDFIERSNIDYWIYGHHHANIPEYSIGKTKMLTNQLGYVKYGEHKYFDNCKVIMI
jgi:predicted phosphohydrolase